MFVARNIFLGFFLAFALPASAFAAELRLAPSTASIEDGETFSISVAVSSPGQAMNAASGVLNFPTDLLQVVSLSKSGSIIGVWVQDPSFSNAAGTVNFEGVVLNPGYIGGNGRVLNVTFRAIGTGSAKITFAAPSVLANDGNGTPILTGTSGADIRITPATERPRAPEPAPQTPAPAKQPAPLIEREAPKTTIERPFDPSWLWSWANAPQTSLAFFILLVLILIFFILDALLLYLYLSKRSLRRHTGAESTTHRNFLLLRDDVERYVELLRKESESRKLTSVESKFVREMKGDLTAAEKDIVQEIRREAKERE